MGNTLTAETLLGELRADGYRVEVEDGKLFLSHPRRRQPSSALLAEVSRLKMELIRLLTGPPEPSGNASHSAQEPPRSLGREGAAAPPVPRPLASLEAQRARMTQGPACSCPSCIREDREASERLNGV